MELKYILESILFNAQQPLNGKALKDLLAETAQEFEEAREFKKVPAAQIDSALAELEKEHNAADRSFRLVCVAESWQFVSKTEFSPWIKTLVGQKNRPSRLSQPALETLAIIAYRQPVTRTEVEEVRGVAVDGVMQTLLERGLVEQVGRAEAAGRPVTFGTTSLFLEYFGLKNLDDLPAGDELRRIVVKKPETLETTEPNGGDGTQGESPVAGTEAVAASAKNNSGAEQEAGGAEVKNPS